MSDKRAVILETYPCAVGAENIAFGMVARERQIASVLRSLGYSVRSFKPTRSSRPSTIGRAHEALRFLPIDPGLASRPDNRVTSRAVETAVVDHCPDILLLRGAGTVIGERVADRCPTAATAVVVSGRYRTSTLATADMVFTETPSQESFLRRRLDRRRLVRLPKFVSPDFFEISADSEKTYDVAVVGKFEAHKNHQAMLPVLEAGHSVVFLGSGTLLDDFQRRASGLPGRASYLGEVDHAIVLETLAASRVLAHPSVSEGFPRAVTEAMAAGLPIVGLRSTLSWPLVDGENAVLVDEAELLPAVHRLVEDDELRNSLGAAARRTAAREFSSAALRSAVLAGERVLAERRPSAPPYRFTVASHGRRLAWDATTRAAKPLRESQRLLARLGNRTTS